MAYGDRGSRGNNPSNVGANEAEDAQQEAAERNLIRKCVDYHSPAVLDVSVSFPYLWRDLLLLIGPSSLGFD